MSQEISQEISQSFPISVNPQEFGSTVVNGWAKYTKTPLFSDLIVNLGDREKIPAHKAILHSFSPKFRSLINDKTKEINIDIKNDQDYQTFKILWNFMYSGKAKLASDQIGPVLAAAQEYEYQPLIEACGEALGPDVSASNVFYYLDIATKYKCERLRDYCGIFIAQNFSDLWDQGTLKTFDVDTWVSVLKSDSLKAKSEMHVFQIVLEYSKKFKGKDKIAVLDKLFGQIRFFAMTPKFLVEEVENNPSISEVPCLHQKCYEAFKHRANPSTAADALKQRKYSGGAAWLLHSHPSHGIGAGLTISEDGLELTKSAASGHALCLGDILMSDGITYFEVTIKTFVSGVNIGVALDNGWSSMYMNNYTGSNAQSWDYCNTGHKINAGAQATYGPPYQQGDKIGVLVNLDNGSLTFYLNGKNLGKAYDLQKNTSYRPSISLYQTSVVTINPEADLPSDL